jgi:hypothetical protein
VIGDRRGTTGAELHGEMAERKRLSERQRMIASGDAVLFTGAGFSAEARDRENNPLPDGKEMVADLYRMLFGAGSPDADPEPSRRQYALGPLRRRLAARP